MLNPSLLAGALSHCTRYRRAILSRSLLAVFGGYFFTALSTASLALAIASVLPRAQAVLAASQLSFALYCAMVIWAFAAATPLRAWIVTGALCTLPVLHLLLVGALP